MKPWNPYAMTFHGQPITGQTPPKLVVYGPPLTAQQGAMLQTAYNAFVGAARVSIVPNPTRQGRLLDGSPYTIECSQGVCTCTVWTEQSSNEDDRRSGIVIQFGDLSGEPLAAHGTTTYLLTPGVKKKTRESTGKWKVRKLKEPMGGGKAVNADTEGTTYFVGIRGKDDEDYPLSHRVFSVNERAIVMEDTEADLAMFRHGEAKCRSADANSPIPFVLTWEKKKYAAQLVFRRISYGVWEVDLRVGPIKQEPSEVIGEIVGTVSFPHGSTLRADKTSFRPDGQIARTQIYRSGAVDFGDFQITPTSLAYQQVGSITSEDKHTSNYAEPVFVSELVYGAGWMRSHVEDNYNEYSTVDGNLVSGPRYVPGNTGTGEYKYQNKTATSFIYAFGPRGEEVYTHNDAISDYRTYSYTHSVLDEYRVIEGPYPRSSNQTYVYERRYEQHENEADGEIVDFIGADSEHTLRIRAATDIEYITNILDFGYDDPSETTLSGSGGTETTEVYESGALTPIFFDRYQKFAIAVEYIGAKTTSVYTTRDWHTLGSRMFYLHSRTVTPGEVNLIVKGRNGVVMRKALDPDTGHFFVAYSASDPMTAALVVNLQKVTPEEPRQRLESWIFVVDDTGVKTIQDLFPGLPENTCARRNHLLYSL